jgi:hypothetical protein
MTLYEPRLGRRRFFDIELQGFHAHAAEYRHLMDGWREDSRQRYEDLACRRPELAEQRQRCV